MNEWSSKAPISETELSVLMSRLAEFERVNKDYQILKQDHEGLKQTHQGLKRDHLQLVRKTDQADQEMAALKLANENLTLQNEWFKRQLFGRKSEKRILAQLNLSQGDLFVPSSSDAVQEDDDTPPQPGETVKGYVRKQSTAKRFLNSSVVEHGLRFDDTVPVKEVKLPNPGLKDLDPDQYEIVSEVVTHRLAQEPSAFVVIKYVRETAKLKSNGQLVRVEAPASVLEKSYADVSFLAGMLVDKFVYHLPLHRQYQRLRSCGITVSRGNLTRMVHKTVELLEPVYFALLSSILQSRVLAMDETPIKATLNRDKHQMKTGYYWPIYGEEDEVAFMFSPSRKALVVEEVLRGFGGVLLTDGYRAYEVFADKSPKVKHAQCWVHVRRKFEQAAAMEQGLCKVALDYIAKLYDTEETIRQQGLLDGGKLAYRREHSRPVVEAFFAWLKNVGSEKVLLPSNPFTRAGKYALGREESLQVFLDDPGVAMDTNHVEREIRGIALGRKNWMFCWTEIGARYAGMVNSLIASCRLHGVNPYTYLVDVLQRVDTHPAFEVHRLIPRLWKHEFAKDPMRSVLDS